MCPSRDEVREYLRTVAGLAAVDNLGSVHLDYIRYPDVILPIALWPKYNLVQDKEYPDFDFCYCDVCRARFRAQSGLDPKELPDPAANQAWLQYRYDTITRVVAEMADVVHARGKRLTAAVFPTPAIARRLVRQDWTKWNVDAVLPMVYNGFYKEDVPWIERARRARASRRSPGAFPSTPASMSPISRRGSRPRGRTCVRWWRARHLGLRSQRPDAGH